MGASTGGPGAVRRDERCEDDRHGARRAGKEDASLEPLRKLSNQLLRILEVAGIGR